VIEGFWWASGIYPGQTTTMWETIGDCQTSTARTAIASFTYDFGLIRDNK